MTIFFTSDEHYGHANIILYSKRPFTDVVIMTEMLIYNHNSVVAPDDDVWHLGDFALDERLVARILPRLNGRHHLVAGNHDACHPHRHKHAGAKRRYRKAGFVEIVLSAELDGFLLCHLPYAGDHTAEDRFGAWRPVASGKWLLHGHVHEAWAIRGRQINVGVDVRDYTPISLDAVRAIRATHESR